MMKRIVQTLAFACVFATLPTTVWADKAEVKLPDDLSVSVESGNHGVVPKVTQRLSLNLAPRKNGDNQIDITRETETRDGDVIEISKQVGTFLLKDADIRTLHGLVGEDTFFKLRDEYEPDEEVDGGGWLRVSVTAAGRTKSVTAKNVEVEVLESIRTMVEEILSRQDALIREVIKAPEADEEPAKESLSDKNLVVGSAAGLEKGAGRIELHNPVANFAAGFGDFMCFVDLETPVTQEQIDAFRAFVEKHPADAKDVRLELVIEFLADNPGNPSVVKGHLIGVGLFPIKPGRRAFRDVDFEKQPFVSIPAISPVEEKLEARP